MNTQNFLLTGPGRPRLLLAFVILLATRLTLSAQPVQIDPAFAPVLENEYPALVGVAFTATTDARLLAVGNFTHVNGTAVGTSRLVRLFADGSLDRSFSAAIDRGEHAQSAAVLADGRLVVVVVGDSQIQWGVIAIPTVSDPNPIPVPVQTARIVRLLANGQVDPDFTPITVFDGEAHVTTLSDSSLIVWGSFTAVDGVPRYGLARFFANGPLDGAYAPSIGIPRLYVQSLVPIGNGQVVLSAESYEPSGAGHIFFVRLTATGTVDASFHPAPASLAFSLLAALSDGSILAGNGSLTRYKTDGSRDSTFSAQIPDTAYVDRIAVLSGDRLAVEARTISVFILKSNGALERDCRSLPGAELGQHLGAVLSDGRIAMVQGPLKWVPAPFTEWSYWEITEMTEPKLCMVDSAAGTLTTLPTTVTRRDPGTVNSLRLDPAGRVLVEGCFTHIDGQPRPGYARYTTDGTLDPAFRPVAARHFFPQSGDRIIGAQTTLGPADAAGIHRDQTRLIRLLADGTLDPAFAPPPDLDLLSANWLAEASDGRLLVSAFAPDNQREENLKLIWLAGDGHLLATLPTVFTEFTGIVGMTDDGVPISIVSPGGNRYVVNAVQSAAILPSGQLLVAIRANKVNGLSRPVIVRLNADGSVDQTYQPDLRALQPAIIALLMPDGRALVYGERQVNGAWIPNFSLRLNPDGSVDPTYVPPAVRGQRLADGSCFYHGRRYHADGSLDLNFHPQFDLYSTPNTAVLTADARLWVGGSFTTVDGQPHNALARFNLIETPGFTVMPVSQTIVAGRGVTFQAALGTSAPATYQWTFNGVPIPGATASTLAPRKITPAQAGAYRLVASTGGQTYTSDAATLTVTPNTSRLVNFSARSRVSPDGPPQIGGFVLRGSTLRPVLLRAIGRGLSSYGLPTMLLLPAPTLRVYERGAALAENTGGALAPSIATVTQRVGAFPDPPTASVPPDPWNFVATRDSALSLALPGGGYTAHTFSADHQSGLCLFEFYDAGELTAPSAVANFSIRGRTAPGDGVLIAGFVIAGNGPLTLLLRGIGPGLAPLGVANVIADPQLTLYTGRYSYAANDNWSDQPEAAAVAAAALSAGAFALPAGSRDAALLVTLEPGAYTVQGSGVAGTTGEMMIELYVVE
jgi:uncharacterized delta-60 repeat protein